VTERKEAENTLREQASLLEKARDAICVVDLQFAITHWNASAERIFGHTAAAATGCSLRICSSPGTSAISIPPLP